MNPSIEKAAAAYVAPKVMKNFKFRWLIYGAAAYYGLKLMNKRGIMTNQTGMALDWIDRGVNFAKERIGMGSSTFDSSKSESQAALTH